MDINRTIGRRVRDLRDAKGWSLDTLSDKSTVSRSNISLIERGQSSPTATVLEKLATALDVTLASLFERGATAVAEPSPVSRRAEQVEWTDPASGYVRRNLSPAVYSSLQLVDVHFPAGERVTYETGARNTDVHQQVWVIEGAMEVTVGDTQWRLDTGDCLSMKLDCPISFFNPTTKAARYLVALTASSHNDWRPNR